MALWAPSLFAALAVALPEWTPARIPLTQVGFEQIAVADNIRVFKHRTSALIHLGAEGRLPAPPDVVQRALLDYERQRGRIARLSEVQVLMHKAQSHTLTVYQRLNLPVIADRDFTLRVDWGQSAATRWIAYRLVADGPKPRRGVVRVPYHSGSWQLWPTADGRGTFVRYQMSIDLGGWLPRWLARSGAGRELPALFESVCRLARPETRSEKCLASSP